MISFSLLVGCVLVALGGSTDLELCKVDEYLLQVGPHQREVLDDVCIQHPSQLSKCLTEQHIAALNVDTLDTIAQLNGLLQCLGKTARTRISVNRDSNCALLLGLA